MNHTQHYSELTLEEAMPLMVALIDDPKQKGNHQEIEDYFNYHVDRGHALMKSSTIQNMVAHVVCIIMRQSGTNTLLSTIPQLGLDMSMFIKVILSIAQAEKLLEVPDANHPKQDDVHSEGGEA